MKTIVGADLYRRIWLCLHLCISIFLLSVGKLTAHELTPTIADFWVEDSNLVFEVRLNAEAFVARLDLDEVTDTESAPDKARYDALRLMASSELEPLVREFAVQWVDGLQVSAGGPVDLSFEGARIPVVGNPDTPRTSKILLTGTLPEQAHSLRLIWPKGAGAVVLRQQGVDQPYTGYLIGGEASPSIPLGGGAGMGAWQSLETFAAKGFERILPGGPQQVFFVLAMLLMSPRLWPVFWQLIVFSVAFFLTLAAGVLEVIEFPKGLILQTVPATIVLMAVANILSRRLDIWRLLAVLLFGLVHGANVSFSLGQAGIPPDHLASALLGYGAGAEIAFVAISLVVLALATLLSQGGHRFLSRNVTLASMIIALIGFYWCFEPYMIA
ncbi:MAG: HupE/UreJ family protein [Ruegeria sp.]